MIVLGPLIAICVVILALVLGGRAERECGALLTVAQLMALALGLASPPNDPFPAALSDVVLLGGFIFLAMRHRRVWLYAEVAIVVTLVAAQLTNDDVLASSPRFRLLIDGLNFAGLGLLLATTLGGRASLRVSMTTIVR